MGDSLQDFKEFVSMEIYGMTAREAVEKGICIQCRKDALPKCYSARGIKEYEISGMCEECFDSIFRDD